MAGDGDLPPAQACVLCFSLVGTVPASGSRKGRDDPVALSSPQLGGPGSSLFPSPRTPTLDVPEPLSRKSICPPGEATWRGPRATRGQQAQQTQPSRIPICEAASGPPEWLIGQLSPA